MTEHKFVLLGFAAMGAVIILIGGIALPNQTATPEQIAHFERLSELVYP